MKAVEIAALLENYSPPRYACEWDNVGMQVGRDDNEVERILVCLDIDDAAVEYAQKNGVNMIVSHHPLIFHGINKINERDFIARRILTLAENRINAFCMHTNFDCTHMAAEAAKRIGLEVCGVLEEVLDGKGIGAVGSFASELRASELACLVKKSFGLEHIVMYGDKDARIKKAALVPGSGKDEIGLALAAGAQAMITGDITYHYGIDGAAQELVIIDAGHYGLEHIFTDTVSDFLERHADGVSIIRMPFNNPQKYF